MTDSMESAPSPSELDGPFGVLLEDTFRRTERIELQLRAVRQRYSARIEDRSYRAFVEALELANEGARERIRQLRDEFMADPDRHITGGGYDELGSFATSLDEQLESYLPLLFRPRSDELEVFAVPFTRLAKQLVPNIELLFFTWSIDGYLSRVYDYDSLRAFDPLMARNLRLGFGRDIRFVQLLHPLTREGDIFHHAVFAHELGHIAVEMPVDARAYDESRDLPEDEVETEESPGQQVTFADDTLRDHPMPDELTGRQQRQLSDWFRELACDIFAMRVIGPAFAIAFAEVTAPNRPLEPDRKEHERSHPPAALRFAVLKQELREYDLGDASDVLMPVLDSYLDSYPRDVQPPPVLQRSEPWLNEALRRFRSETVDILLDGRGMRPTQLRDDLPIIFELADRDIPPSERLIVFDEPTSQLHGNEVHSEKPADDQRQSWSVPLDWRSVLNGMLLWHLRAYRLPPADLGEDVDYFHERSTHRRKAVNFALAAVELSEFHDRATRLRGELRDMSPVEMESET